MPAFEFPVNNYLPGFLRCSHPLAREFMSEFASTFLFLLCGVGCVIQFNTSKGANDTFLSLNLAWGFAVAFGAGLGIGCSGGHMNPAVTFSQYLLGFKTYIQVLVYAVAQTLGAFAGTAVAYGNYQEAINTVDGGARVAGGNKGTLCYLVTCGARYESHWDGILDQTIGTAVLTMTMCSVLDKRNEVPKFLHPLFGGLVVMMIGMCYGVNDGYPINPARDLGARIFASFIYGGDAFSYGNYWFWVPLTGPMIGGVAGTIFYNFLFDYHTPQHDVPSHNDVPEKRTSLSYY